MSGKNRSFVMRILVLGLLLSTQCLWAVSPVSPNASKEAIALLDYLYTINGKKCLSGTQEMASNPTQEYNYIYSNTGKYPAILGLDMCDRPSATTRIINWWKAGGIAMVGWHMGWPTGDEGYTSAKSSHNSSDIDKVLTSGTNENTKFNQRLDEGAVELKKLKDANVPIIWRPFHEAGQGCSWFWWGMGTPAQYVRLYQYMFDYYTKTKGLTNLIWLVPMCSSPTAAFFPPKSYYDLGGADNYANDHTPQLSMYNNCLKATGTTTVPVGYHECGRIPDPAQMVSQGAKWVLFMSWNGYFVTDGNYNPKDFLKTTYNHSFIANRGDLPDFKNYVLSTQSSALSHNYDNAMIVKKHTASLEITVPFSGNATVSLFDMRGKTVYSSKALLTKNSAYSFVVTKVTAGMHVLRVAGDNNRIEKKVMF